jgi:2-deoxy-D-gluconate 3-dehydrogenase
VHQLLKALLKMMAGKKYPGVNAIAPTFVETPLTRPMFEEKGFRDSVLKNIPLGRIANTKDVAGAAVYLASEASSMVTGHVLLVDGGWTAH